MLNKKLEKQIRYYDSKCWEYHNRMMFANPVEMSKFRYQYDKHNAKRSEIRKIIESDGKHRIMKNANTQQLIIEEVANNGELK